MGWVKRLLNSGPRASRVEKDLEQEVAFHRQQYAADLEAEGMAPDEARREAQRRVGLARTWIAEAVDQDTLPWVSTLWRETRQAVRGLRRRPWLVLTTTMTLALGIGVLLAAFTVVDRALLAPLPFPAPDRLVVLAESFDGEPTGGNPARLADWGRSLAGLKAVAGLYGDQLVMVRGRNAQRVRALRGVGPLSQVFGLRPSLGRGFSDDEEREGASVAVLTDGGWERLFARDPQILDARVSLRGEPYRIVGVLPPGVADAPDTDLVAPAGPGFQRAPRGGNWLRVVGRLQPGVSAASLEQEARAVARRFAEINPEFDKGLDVRVVPFAEDEVQAIRTPVLLLIAAAGTVFLVVCVNLAGLLLVRALARDHESSIRVALGAGRWAMARLAVHEAAILAVAALPLAWVVGSLVLRWMVSAIETDLPQAHGLTLGGRTLAAGMVVLVTTVLLLSIWPAWHVATRAARPLAAAHAVTDGRSRRHLRRALVCVQVACSTMLVVLALLLGASLREMLSRPRGFDARSVVAVRYDLDWEQPKAQVDAMVERVLRLVDEVPGVVAAGVVDRFPLQGGTQTAQLQLYGEPATPAGRPDVSVRSATPGYFAAMGIPVRAGRVLVDDPTQVERREVMINEAFARAYFPGQDPLGRRLAVRWEPGPPVWHEVVGVVGDVRREWREDAPAPEIYRPWSRTFWPLLHVGIRTDGSPDVLSRVQQHLMRQIPGQPIAMAGALDDVLAEDSRRPRTLGGVMAACAGTAALLAMIALHGLLASEMLARRREVGIRLALGARTWQLRAWLVRPGVALVVLGILLGLVLSVPAARALESQLFGVRSGAWVPRVAAAVALAAAGLVAAVMPAWRLVSERALQALRYE